MHRTSKTPTGKRRHYYLLAACKLCQKTASAKSVDGALWTIGTAPPCQPSLPACGATPAAATVECFTCLEDTEQAVSCPAGHHLCGTCINRTLADFEFRAGNAYMVSLGLEFDINTMPFMCTMCGGERVSASFPQAACLKFCSQATINHLFNKLRKFQLLNGGSQQPAQTSSGEPRPIQHQLCVGVHPQSAPSDASETATVTQMLKLFFEPPKCPSCGTPFAHDGGCMSMSCRGRPGVLCNVKFCLWCVHIANFCHLFDCLAGA
jgi:hypothetical protein